ncbi:MAG: hypothetical protein H9901_05730 [Candidatus Paralactobacillus gallistercoris]|uniref:HNH endonuclease n=1 Tax=Candidatus Paralactobacillus gallistercoris TaxID=2838724 RepID=A0A948X012_9LACO|nr:hypothetical protein [Candidatus Paralactobacillus gallistercoris]
MPKVRRCREPGCHYLCEYPLHYCRLHHDQEQQYLQSRMKWANAHHNHHKQHVYNTLTRNRNTTKTQKLYYCVFGNKSLYPEGSKFNKILIIDIVLATFLISIFLTFS